MEARRFRAVGLLRIPASVLAGFLSLGCASVPLEPLPVSATGEGISIEATSESGAYTLSFAGASADIVGGSPIAATRTAVTQASGSGPPLEIRSARSTWDLKNHTAHFEGDVVVVRGDVTMRCAALDVRYAEADRIDTVVATGGVLVETGERRASADRAELLGATGKITLTGKPRLAEGVNALVGERIILWLDDEKADCEGGASGPCTLVVEGRALGQ